ncbi:toll/interleukin-1 receptor domain-containing protein [Streptomyces otsuchiensis]|uniref:toll/interleukin-1 receptor domain-containing protein n=1 Tax=Streptomyces otsuchiensis TaxID=2681388 RepID=UPI0010321ABC|nr:toll/interleukin-1 receptor domain-containing protein [Streptomyces otsuchiensis]
MPEIFINYRTGYGDETANLIERELSRRFGDERVFKDSKSIGAGTAFPKELVRAVRECEVMIVVIGHGWCEATVANGSTPALMDPNDWTRREIIQANEDGAIIIPVLVGYGTRLERQSLPPELAFIADYQYRCLDHSAAQPALSQIGNDVVKCVRHLAEVDRGSELAESVESQVNDHSADSTNVHTDVTTYNQRGGVGTIGRDFGGTVVSDSRGPVNTGRGAQNNGPQFIGENTGINYAERGDFRGVEQNFGTSRDKRDSG